MNKIDKIKIMHDTLKKKFYCIISDKESLVEYDFVENTDNNKIIDIYHTFVPQELRGEGIAKELYFELIKYIEENNIKVRPTCSYALKIFSSEKYDKYLEHKE
ncbi:MAG: GNAT family N-acetyltransferase [Candidatus Woesearchaeota archaeon]